MLERLRGAYEELTERERRLVTVLGVLLGLFALFVPSWLVLDAIATREAERDEIRAVLRDIERASDRLAAAAAERRAALARYETPAPPLGSFLEARAREAGYTNPLEVTDQPDRQSGGYTRRSVRVTLPGVGLRTTIGLLSAVDRAPYPVAVDRIQVDHFQSGDRYNVQLGVVAFDRVSSPGGPGPSRARAAVRAGGRAGPEAP
ncbi:MAG: type II secretion system protein M [Myxococcota bacterium]|nr:type II secretion system protein M [Myxococcota bacterium]MDW8360824.1 type II secretion system protein GspM [Myxococcales bacterium]